MFQMATQQREREKKARDMWRNREGRQGNVLNKGGNKKREGTEVEKAS